MQRKYIPVQKIITRVITLILLSLIIFTLLIIYRSYETNNITNILLSDNCNNNSLNNWIDKIIIDKSKYIKDNNIDYPSLFNDYPLNTDSLLSSFPYFLKNIQFIETKTRVIPINDISTYLPLGLDMDLNINNEQAIAYNDIYLSIDDEQKICSLPLTDNTNKVVNIKGLMDMDEFINILEKSFDELTNKQLLFFPDTVNNSDIPIITAGRDILLDTTLNSDLLIDPLVIDLNVIKIGTLSIEDRSDKISIYFSLLDQQYLFNVSEINSIIFNTIKEDKHILILKSSNYSLSPVSKQFELTADYVPNVKYTNLNGGGYLEPITLDNLKNMVRAMSKSGIDISVISAYRSYTDQNNTFNYWVNREVNAGLSRSEAIIKANNYSAFPGQSEHQLGTTLDLKCKNCNSFDNSEANLKLYGFLKEHAHEYGFIISYPEGKSDLTGYKSEPWHIRYIGIPLATKLFEMSYLDSENQMYLTRFLVEMNY